MLLRVVLAGSVAACGLATVGSGPVQDEPEDAQADSARGSRDAGDATAPTDSTVVDTSADASSIEAASQDRSPPDAADAPETVGPFDGDAADGDAGASDSGAADSSTPDTNVTETNAPDTNVADTNVADTNVVDSVTVDSAETSGADCGPPPTVASPLTAHGAPGPITIDGQLGDWPCSAFVALNASNGTLLIGTGPEPLSGEFAVLWDSQTLYVAAHILDPTISTNPGDSGTPWYDDAVETYFSGDQSPSGNYTSLDHQFVVDWKNLGIDYADAVPTANPGFVSATSVDIDAGAWSLELSMPASAVGLPQFQSSTQIGFDILFEQGSGTAQNYQLVWHAPQPGQACSCDACCCTSNSYPFCDVLSFGVLQLAP
jgi:hypothetical protein